jgi:hypothetical protein
VTVSLPGRGTLFCTSRFGLSTFAAGAFFSVAAGAFVFCAAAFFLSSAMSVPYLIDKIGFGYLQNSIILKQ